MNLAILRKAAMTLLQKYLQDISKRNQIQTLPYFWVLPLRIAELAGKYAALLTLCNVIIVLKIMCKCLDFDIGKARVF